MREAATEPRNPCRGEILLPTNRVLIYDISHLSECDLCDCNGKEARKIGTSLFNSRGAIVPLRIHLATPKTMPGLVLGSIQEPSLHHSIAFLTASAVFQLCVGISLALKMLILRCAAERS